jgi:hypothetical protein
MNIDYNEQLKREEQLADDARARLKRRGWRRLLVTRTDGARIEYWERPGKGSRLGEYEGEER